MTTPEIGKDTAAVLDKLSCPECAAAGEPRMFGSAQGLARHRIARHGVAPKHPSRKKAESPLARKDLKDTERLIAEYQQLQDKEAGLELELEEVRKQLEAYAPISTAYKRLREAASNLREAMKKEESDKRTSNS